MIRDLGTIASLLLLLAASPAPGPAAGATEREPAGRTVRATVQLRPRGPVVEADVPVRSAPVDVKTVKAARARLAPDDLVLGVVVAGRPVAYPVRFLAAHEVVNHRVEGRPVAPSWCPVYATGIVFARELGGDELTFDFAAGLHRDNLLIADRETGSLWSQLGGFSIAGPAEGERLTPIPTMQTTWDYWRQRHPKTRVLVDDDAEGEPYYYGDYGRSTHDTSSLGLGIALVDAEWFFPFVELQKTNGSSVVRAGGRTVTIVYERDGLTAWVEDETGARVPSVLAYVGAWKRFFPRSEIWSAAPE